MSNINNNNKNKSENGQRTSPRFSNINVPPQYYDNNYSSRGFDNSATSSASNSNQVTPTRGNKRNSTNRVESSIEEQQAAIESNNMQFYLQKLDLLYQNLEGRVQKLESIVADQLLITNSNPPYAVVSRNSQINNSGAGFNMSDFSIGSSSTSTSTNTLIPTVNNAIPTTSSTSTICSLLEPVQKEISVLITAGFFIILIYTFFRNLIWMIIVYQFFRRGQHHQLEN